jgi:3-hydroxyisobutyrate dehydrogenase-like beta-hydroxyacid dehydrogenase
MLQGEFPTRVFSADYAAKDLSYAMQLARELGIELAGAETTNLLLAETNRRGYGQEYYPAVIKVIDPDYT